MLKSAVIAVDDKLQCLVSKSVEPSMGKVLDGVGVVKTPITRAKYLYDIKQDVPTWSVLPIQYNKSAHQTWSMGCNEARLCDVGSPMQKEHITLLLAKPPLFHESVVGDARRFWDCYDAIKNVVDAYISQLCSFENLIYTSYAYTYEPTNPQNWGMHVKLRSDISKTLLMVNFGVGSREELLDTMVALYVYRTKKNTKSIGLFYGARLISDIGDGSFHLLADISFESIPFLGYSTPVTDTLQHNLVRSYAHSNNIDLRELRLSNEVFFTGYYGYNQTNDFCVRMDLVLEMLKYIKEHSQSGMGI